MPTKTEKTKDYKFFFECVAKAVQQCEDIEYRPTILVADAASSITKGFRRAFNYSEGEFTRVVCWQHVKRGVIKHLNLVSKEERGSIKDDIHILQECSSTLIFNGVVKLFLKKWQSKEKDFVNYFKKQWLSKKRNGWYQGYAVGVPDHNNANEADNRYIKEGWFFISLCVLLLSDVI